MIRYDGSSRFPTSKRYAIFPSLAAGWLISEELFIKDKFDWITELKLKGSYGILGNQNIVENLTSRVVSNYPYQNILNTGYNYPFGNSISPGVARVKIVDPNLRWESTRTADAGLEIALFKNLLTFSSTYYNRFTYDILVSPNSSVSKVLGFEVGIQNSGKLRNTGWEFTLGHQNKINEFSYNVNLNFSTVKNKVVDLGIGNINQSNGMVGNGSDLFIGYPIQAYYGYQTAGLFVDAADVASWADQKSINPQSQPGDIRYKDISGPDGVPDGKVDATYDRTVIGSRIPKYTYGINLGFNYKGFDLGLLLQGVSGVQGLLNNYAGFALNQNGNIQRWQADGRWTTANPDRNAVYPRFEQLPNTGSPNTQLSDYWLLNASYIRLKNVQLGYAIPKNLLTKWKLSGLRIYANAENIFTSSNYRKGWDPEINSSGAYYPIMRNFTFGVNLSF
ncbi:TonB dependent receptor [compost metagenome]